MDLLSKIRSKGMEDAILKTVVVTGVSAFGVVVLGAAAFMFAALCGAREEDFLSFGMACKTFATALFAF